jgi:putative restriction endonuclease
MLRYGLQDMHGVRLALPSRRGDRPDQQALEERYETFRNIA